MEKLAVGVLAHVDAGKTTLSEALLYRAGVLKRLGRVDHADAFLDTEALERERGITIFSKQAILPLGDREATLVDTPGHADFAAEAERVLPILDCAVLVIGGADGVQGHTETLWRLLRHYGVPTFLFVNKMDQPGVDRSALLAELRRLDPGCVDFSLPEEALWEEAATCGEGALERYLDAGRLETADLRALVAEGRLFPCYFGSALKLDGVDELLTGLDRYAPRRTYPAEFSARVYKISRDGQGNRLTFLKITGGTLRVKDTLSGPDWQEKIDQIRLYSGAKFRPVDGAEAGTVCAVTGLSRTKPGMGLGAEPAGTPPLLEPVLTYEVLLAPDQDPHQALAALRTLEDEDPMLRVVWNEGLGVVHVQLMGQIQLEILGRVLRDRFDLPVDFGPGGVVYRETIAGPVEGVGHFEPLRHYAEVHLLLEPLPRGSGVELAAACPEDVLDGRWQRLILTHLAEKEHRGVLTGSPVTDVRLTLTAGRAHEKHTEGGDFRQATYRAVRQGLMRAKSVLLEPWYAFRLDLPTECLGRAISDVQRMDGDFDPPENDGDRARLAGRAPVRALRDYAAEVTAYTKGRGRLFCEPDGCRPCQDQEELVAALGNDPERDLEDPPDSVFCAHGAGYTVKWDQVEAHMHLAATLAPQKEPERAEKPPKRAAPGPGYDQDKELQAIYERTYGPVRQKAMRPTPREPARPSAPAAPAAPAPTGPEYLLVDGYNVIYAWDALKEAAKEGLANARQLLMDILSNYQGFHRCELILVFDAYKVPHNTGDVSKYHNIYVVYTKEAETADAYIEKATARLAKDHRVRVATSDGAEQLIILGHGALRVSARAFLEEVERTEGQIADVLKTLRLHTRGATVRETMEQKRTEG